MDGVWTVVEAKAKFSELTERVRRDGLFAASPLHGAKLKIRRSKSRTRPVSL